MKKLTNYTLQHDLYSIIEAGCLLQCKEVDGKHFMEWVIEESPLHKKEYHYELRKEMMEDHYKISSYHFQNIIR